MIATLICCTIKKKLGKWDECWWTASGAKRIAALIKKMSASISSNQAPTK